MKKAIVCTLLTFSFLCACTSMQDQVTGTSQTQLQMRNYQSRTFDTADRERVLRSVISTLQDLGFIIDKADEKLGTISGTSFSKSSKMTVSVRQINKGQILVRTNAQAGLKPIETPQAYQNFFNALAQSLFLDAHMVQ